MLDAFDDFDGDSDSEKPTLKPSNLHERSPLPSSCVRYSGTPGLRGILDERSRASQGLRFCRRLRLMSERCCSACESVGFFLPHSCGADRPAGVRAGGRGAYSAAVHAARTRASLGEVACPATCSHAATGALVVADRHACAPNREERRRHLVLRRSPAAERQLGSTWTKRAVCESIIRKDVVTYTVAAWCQATSARSNRHEVRLPGGGRGGCGATARRASRVTDGGPLKPVSACFWGRRGPRAG